MKRASLFHIFLLAAVAIRVNGFVVTTPTAASKTHSTILQKAALVDYASSAAALFNNMKTPASIIGGAMIPIGFASPLKFEGEEGEGKFAIFLRKFYPFMSVLALCSELMSVMWATVAVNQLTETKIAPASSVWALIQRDFALPWVATNAHFVLGMLAFIWVICSRVYFMAASKHGIGASAAGLAMSSMLLITSVVNRGVASGGGGGDDVRFGANILSLFRTYSYLFLKRAFTVKSFGPLELCAAGLALGSLINTIRLVILELKQVKKSGEV